MNKIYSSNMDSGHELITCNRFRFSGFFPSFKTEYFRYVSIIITHSFVGDILSGYKMKENQENIFSFKI